MTDHVDWRGVPINIGDTVIYGSGVGQSIQLNEAEVVKLGPGEIGKDGKDRRKITVRIIRRSYMQGTRENVSVGADRLTVVTGALPPSDKLTQAEAVAEEAARMAENKRIAATHNMADSYYTIEPYAYGAGGWYDKYSGNRNVYHPAKCRDCGTEYPYNRICVDSPDQGIDSVPLTW